MRFAIPCLLAALTASAAQRERPSVSSQREEVVVDLVVHDKKGHVVQDLRQDQIALTDNGVSKPISSFRLVQGNAAQPADAPGAESAKLDPAREVRLISLIFDQMNISDRVLARQAAFTVLDQNIPPNVYVAVFGLGGRLNALQPFTNNKALLHKAVDRATSGAYAGMQAVSDGIRNEVEQVLGPNQSPQQSLEEQVLYMNGSDSSGAPAGAPPGGGRTPDQTMATMLLGMLQLDDRTVNNEPGRNAILALLSAVEGQYSMPGRKTILFFTSGFRIPEGMVDAFHSVISTANKNNVTFYPFDARGLTTAAQNSEATAQLAAGAIDSRVINHTTDFDAGNIDKNAAQSQDTALTSGRYNTQDTLAELADRTGGVLTANTNDFRGPAIRILEDVETYYELTYNPSLDKYDGTYHKIEIRSTRPDLKIQSRDGYYALPPSLADTGGLSAYTLALMRALNATPLPHAFPFEAGGLHFRGDAHNETCAVLIEAPFNNLTFRKDGQSYQAGLSYVSLIKDSRGSIVKKLEGDLPLKLQEQQILSFRQSQFTDAEYFDVPPGFYTIETAILDRESGKTSVRRNAFFVPRPKNALSLSSVSLIRSWHGKEPDAPDDDPFVLNDKTITPTLEPKFNKSVSNSLPFYLVVYPDPDNSAKPEITIEFVRDGQARFEGKPELSAPDQDGRIRLIATAPIDKLDPGNYAVRFLVRQGNQHAEEDFAFNLAP